MSRYYTIITNVGKAKIANAQVLGRKLDLIHIAVGDSGANPNETQTSLRNEVWRGPVGTISVDDDNPNWIVLEGVIPSDVGGFNVLEVGVYDSDGDLIAIGKYPDTYKPTLLEGSAKDLYLRMIIEVTNAASVQLKVDPTIAIPSRKWVGEEIEKAKAVLIPKDIMGQPNGVATLGPDGKVPMEQLKDVATKQEVEDLQTDLDAHLAEDVNHVRYGTASGTNAKTIALSPSPTNLVEGMALSFKNTKANTGAVTLNVNGLGAKPIVKSNGNALTSGNLKAGSIYTVRYSGESFILQGEGGEYGTAIASQVLSPYTIGTETGLVTGTIPSKGAATITPGRTNQTIAAGQYLSGVQTILGATDLLADNIVKGKSIFGVAGTFDGKKWASGTVSTNGTGRFARIHDDAGHTLPKVTVSGLQFRPSTVLLWDITNNRYSTILYPEDLISTGYTARILRMDHSAIGISAHKLMLDAYVIQGGFQLPVEMQNINYKWYAFE